MGLAHHSVCWGCLVMLQVAIIALAVSTLSFLAVPGTAAPHRSAHRDRSRAIPAWLPAGLLCAACVFLIGPPAGLIVGPLVGLVVHLLLPRFESAKSRKERIGREKQLPLFVDLVAACLSAGIPTEQALNAAATAVGDPLGGIVQSAVTSIRWGADPIGTWRAIERIDGLQELAGCLVRASESGAPLAELLPALARGAREVQRTRIEARTRTTGVRLMAPLGLMFLPAFILLGVVPVVASWASLLLTMQ